MARIFINFRNFDGDWAALAIRNTLIERLDDDEVFLSSFSIMLGADWAAELLNRAAECDVLLAIIGPRWLTVTGQDGRPKLGAADDWVSREIEAALAARRAVVPVLVDGADRLREADLPPRIARLAGLQGYRLNRPQYAADMSGLEGALRMIIPDLPRKTTAASSAGANVEIKIGKLTGGTVVGGSYPAGYNPSGWYAIKIDEASEPNVSGVIVRDGATERPDLSLTPVKGFPVSSFRLSRWCA
jgi:hypothetical protein